MRRLRKRRDIARVRVEEVTVWDRLESILPKISEPVEKPWFLPIGTKVKIDSPGFRICVGVIASRPMKSRAGDGYNVTIEGFDRKYFFRNHEITPVLVTRWSGAIDSKGEVVRVDLIIDGWRAGYIQLATSGTWAAYLSSPVADDAIVVCRGVPDITTCKDCLIGSLSPEFQECSRKASWAYR